MADKKISALTSATTPLAGTEVLPIVQSGATVKVAVSDLTAGRAISATAVTASTGNFIVGTSGQGVDFSATPGTGTSELLDDYEEGTWTPTVTGDGGTNGTLAFTSSGTYTKVGRVVTLNGIVALTNLGSLTGRIGIGGMPFNCDVEVYFGSFGAANINPTGSASIGSWSGAISTNRVHFAITLEAAGGMDSLRFTQLTTSTSLWFTISYITTA